MKTRTIIAVLVILGILLPFQLEAVAWKLSRSFWTEEDENAYGSFIEKICDSKHSNLNRFIRDPKSNPFYGEEDKKFNLYSDCADLPYLIRSYVAYKLRLPFSYVSEVSGNGGDQRYSRGNRPTEFRDQDYFSSPQKLFGQVTLINSGFYRMAAAIENSDHYPVKIQKDSIRPGTIYYDPDGHVAIVAKVMPDGRIRLIDAHPDRSISKPWFGAKFTRGSNQNGGGFKRWRPIRYTSEGNILRSSNHNISDYSAVDQFQKSYSIGNRKGLSYYDYVRNRLADSSYHQNPLSEFATMMSDLYEDILYRAVAVNICIEKGIDKKPHPGSLPWNIYGTDGLWEEFSTPSRDARLKVAFRDFYERTRSLVLQQNQVEPSQAQQLAVAMLQHYHAVSPKFSVNYTDSTGKIRILSFDDVCNRLFKLSFDPYHSIEYRWGADEDELALSPDNQSKKRFYELEYRLRHQLERVYNQATPLSMGPEKPVEVSVKNWLQAFLQGQIIYDQVEKGLVCADASFPPGMSPAEIQLRKQKMAALPELIASNPHELNSDKAAETSMEKVETISSDHEKFDDHIARFAGEVLSALDLVAAQIMHLPANSNEN